VSAAAEIRQARQADTTGFAVTRLALLHVC
jgi:hypothetical protein